ncbi:MAG: hypothetical protein ACRCVG_08305 [Methanobacteriaceae archaeon]
MTNEKQLWKKVYMDGSVFRIPEDVRFVKEVYLEHDTIHIHLYKSETVQIRIRMISFDVGNFEMVKSHIRSQVAIQDTTIGVYNGYTNEGEYDFIQEFNYPDYHAENNVNISIHSSEDSFYNLSYYQFIEKMIGSG